MWIKGGEHRGLMCTVLAVENATGTATVRLQPSDETATVNFEDVAERWERSEWHEKADLRRVGRARDGEEGKERHRKEKHKQKYGDCDREGRGDRDREYLHER